MYFKIKKINLLIKLVQNFNYNNNYLEDFNLFHIDLIEISII